MSVPCPFFISQQIASCEIKSLRRDGYFFVVSVARGLVIGGCLILFLPMLFRAESLWLAMLVTELLAAFFVTIRMRRATVALPEKEED